MEISVIIPTYNGEKKLPALLESLAVQDVKPHEIIVVVDGSTDNTVDLLTKYCHLLGNLKIVVQENRGRSVVRNRGAQASKGDLLIFFDDDMLPETFCISKHVEHHYKLPGTILTGAQIDSNGPLRNDIEKYKSILSIRWSRPLQKLEGKPLDSKHLFITAANFSIAKHLFLKLGGFDERLRDAEDFDLAVRAYNFGVPLYYSHNAFAWHNDSVTGCKYILRLRQYDKAHKKLRDLKPELYSQVSQFTPYVPIGIKRNFFKFFAHPYWVNWLDEYRYKKYLPKKMRYLLYEWIITANGVFFPEKVKL